MTSLITAAKETIHHYIRSKTCFKSLFLYLVHTTLEESENGGFTLKTHQMFSAHCQRRRNSKTQQLPDILDLCLLKTRLGKSHDYRDYIDF